MEADIIYDDLAMALSRIKGAKSAYFAEDSIKRVVVKRASIVRRKL